MEAYYNTNYLAYISPTQTLCININKLQPELDELLDLHQVNTWAYITAWNPFSDALELQENRARNKTLETYLLGQIYFQGKGVAIQGDWEEESYLILGIKREIAGELGRLFQQNAILFGQKGKAAEIVRLSK